MNLAPLETRRDIALLGVIHRCVLGKGPSHFKEFFKTAGGDASSNKKHSFQLAEFFDSHSSDFVLPGSRPAEYICRSALGLISVYNKLPSSIVEACPSVSSFQASLQRLVKGRAAAGCADWHRTLSPRVPPHRHPLNSCW